MQTLEPQTLASDLELEPDPPRKGRTWAFIGAGLAVVLVVGAIAYAIGSSQSTTKTIVKTGGTPPSQGAAAGAASSKAAATPKCLPGVAAGSCNIDEANEAN